MGRPSLAVQRKAEILEAFGRCVARFGLEGSSLEKIAEEAGMQRSILRHYIGNRDELVESLAVKVIDEYREETKQYFDQLPDYNRANRLVDFLVPAISIGSTEQLLIIEALIGGSHDYPSVQKLVAEYIEEFVNSVAEQLKIISPDSSPKKCWETAYGLVCVSFNQESLQPLKLPDKYLKAARTVAKQMIACL